MDAFSDLDDAMRTRSTPPTASASAFEPRAPAVLRGRPVSGAAERQPVEIIGRFRSRPVTAELEGNGEGSKFQSMTRIAGNATTMRISPSEAAKLGYALTSADTVVLLDRPGQPRLGIARVGARERWRVELGADGRGGCAHGGAVSGIVAYAIRTCLGRRCSARPWPATGSTIPPSSRLEEMIKPEPQPFIHRHLDGRRGAEPRGWERSTPSAPSTSWSRWRSAA